jgi:CRISPR/Cas system-associated protein Cas7 (RAMP superfamily)
MPAPNMDLIMPHAKERDQQVRPNIKVSSMIRRVTKEPINEDIEIASSDNYAAADYTISSG